jgi:hypothetical protein
VRRHLELTAVFRKVPEGYVAFIEELPGAKQRKVTTIPRHRDVDEYLAKKICRDLGVREP